MQTVAVIPTQTRPIETDRNIHGPDKFTGKQPETFYRWMQGMELKLSITTFKSIPDGLRYIHSFLDEDAWSMVSPRIPSMFGRPCPNPYDSVEEMLKHLAERYGETNTEARYLTKMENLRQGPNETFSTFYAKFQQYSAYVNLPNHVLIHNLEKKLNSAYKNKVRDGTVYTDINTLVRRLTNIENQFEDDKEDKSSNNNTNQGSSSNSKKGNGKGQGQGQAQGQGQGNGAPPDPKYKSRADLPAKFRDLKPLLADERERCKTEGLCNRCREKGHLQSETDKCPLGHISNSAMSYILRNSGTAVSSTDTPSGKE